MEKKELCGVLVIDKPAGITSHDVVGKVRRLFGTRRVGHTGTLDPMATGVLVVLVGRAAKAAEYLCTDRKGYRALLQLGITTDTEDVTGAVLTKADVIPPAEEVLRVAESFVGEILQVPPMYSALKVGGKKLVDLARKGIKIERAARPVTVYDLTCAPEGESCYALEVTCSAGTYIRTLCADIGKQLGCGGAMAALRRTATGGFTLEDAHSLQELEVATAEQRSQMLIPVESLFATLPSLHLPVFYERLARNGCEIYLQKIGVSHPVGTRLRLCSQEGRFFALGEVCEYEQGLAAKPIKHFDL